MPRRMPTYLFLVIYLLIVHVMCCRGELSFRRKRSHGCGPHPIDKIMTTLRADYRIGDISEARLYRTLNQNDDLAKELIDELILFDDCVRTGDGMKYKKDDRQDFYHKFSFYLER